MVWDQLSINKPHLVYIILGGFTSMFMLVSLFIKEKLYIGEATVATICGLIFGPHGANLINPLDWGNTDQITLEFSRIVLVVQCFAVGVELPKAYMERHWKSVTMLLVPVMTFGWLITSLFIWWLIEPLSWLESLCAAACVTATDPVLASSVVGKGKFAKRVPKHIRDILSAESGCNDGMAFPFIYLALNLIHYHLSAKEVTFHWFCYTVLYECIWGATYGVLVGYIARHAIKLAERKGIIDRESFLVFYFVLALFCAGSGSMLGMDDLLIGFAAGVGFSNDGWFTERTEESHVSNVIDLLLNLTYFVYLGTIIPWDQFNSHLHGLDVWRLVVIAILVIFFRRIPIMLMLKPIIPDIKTWREALFCGHFGPIGVGAIFVAILARAELETHGTTPLATLPDPSDAEYTLIYTIWPITTFLVIASIVVHGSSIAVFTLGKRINTLTLSLSYTQGNDQSSNWMNRLPRISSQGKPSMSRADSSDYEDEKLDLPPGALPPIGIPKLHLRRQKEEEYAKPPNPLYPGHKRSRSRKRKKEGYGGPISDSAIAPARRSDPGLTTQESNSDTLQGTEQPSPESPSPEDLERLKSGESDSEPERQRRKADREQRRRSEPGRVEEQGEDSRAEVEAYEEGENLVVEDKEGNVIATVPTAGKTEEEKAAVIDKARKKVRQDASGHYAKEKHEPHAEKTEGEKIGQDVEQAAEQPERHFFDAFKGWKGFGRKDGQVDGGEGSSKPPERKRGAAHAYQFGNTIIVEDEDGEVIKKYTLPKGEGEVDYNKRMREGVHRMSTWVGLGRRPSQAPDMSATKLDEPEEQGAGDDQQKEKPSGAAPTKKDAKPKKQDVDEGVFGDDDGLRMVISRTDRYGLTGRHKPRAGDRPDLVTMGGGRRLSTKDFLKQMQQMDQESRLAAISSSDAPEDVKAAARRGEFRRESQQAVPSVPRPDPKRSGTLPVPEESQSAESKEAADYFSAQPTGQDDKAHPAAPTSPGSRPAVNRGDTVESLDTIGEEDIPTHNVRGTVARHGQGLTDAERRRERFRNGSAAAPERIDEEDNDTGDEDDSKETPAERRRRLGALGRSKSSDDEDDQEAETAAERRRRLAALGRSRAVDDDDDEEEEETAAERRRRLGALGVRQPGDESSSESDEDVEPRANRAVQEPDYMGAPTGRGSPTNKRQQPAAQPQAGAPPAQPVPRTRIQWGGETRGHVRGEQEEGAAGEGSTTDTSGSVGKKFRGLFKK